MNQTDKNNIAGAIPKDFVDISYSEYYPYVKIGFVNYNDLIESFAPLTKITDETSKENFKKNFDSTNRFGRTDTGLALKKGWELLMSGQENAKGVLVLITDGEIDLNPLKSGRGISDSVNDLDYVVAEAKNNNVPVYTVTLENSDLRTAYLINLKDISQNTGAQNYVAKDPGDSLKIARSILSSSIPKLEIPPPTYPENVPTVKNPLAEIILIIISAALLIMIYCREKLSKNLNNRQKEVD